MDKVERLQPLRLLAKDAENQAAIVLQQAQIKFAKEQQRLVVMENYHAEYHQEIYTRTLAGISSLQLQRLYHFIQQLVFLIQQQKTVIQQAEHGLEQKKKNWQERYTHRKMLDKLIEKHQKQIMYKKDKMEQQIADELFSRRRSD